MDTLKNKRFESYTYLSRYSGVPFYYDTLGEKEVYGIGTNMLNNTAAFSYKICPGDTLDKLALKYYNNPTFWWVIAYFNEILDAFEPLSVGTIIQIPSISSISFGNVR